MSGCMKCGKELQIGDRVVWRCEDCARKQMEEYDNKDQRISELEEQLKNTPKYTVYSKVFFIDDCEKIIKEDFVEQITINHRDGIYYELVNNLLFEECELFATKEEAQAKLEKCEKLQ